MLKITALALLDLFLITKINTKSKFIINTKKVAVNTKEFQLFNWRKYSWFWSYINTGSALLFKKIIKKTI